MASPPWWQRLTLRQQQALILGCGTGLGILALVLGGSLLTRASLVAQLQQQAETELTLIQAAYQSQGDRLVALSQTAVQHPDVSVTLRLEVPTPFLESFIQEQMQANNLELGVLITPGRQIVSSIQRLGQTFAPASLDPLIQKALEEGQPQQALAIIPWQTFVDAQSPLPPGFSNQEGLVQAVIIPVRDPQSPNPQEAPVLGTWILAALINQKPALLQGVLGQLPREADGIVAVFARGTGGGWQPVVTVGAEGADLTPQIPRLTAAPMWQGTLSLAGQTLAVATQTRNDANGDPVMLLVRGIPMTALRWGSYWGGVGALVGVLILGGGIAFVLSNRQVQVIAQLNHAVTTRQPILLEQTDGLGDLATGLNTLMQRLAQQEDQLQTLLSRQQETMLGQQSQSQRLQENLMNLILAMDAAQRGDLTTTAPVSEDELGSLADALNAILSRLRQWFSQVSDLSQSLVTQLQQGSSASKGLILELGTSEDQMRSSLETSSSLSTSLTMLETTSAGILTTLSATTTTLGQEQELLHQAHQALGGIRSAVADTAKQTKRLGESVQDIAQMIAVVLDVADRTNLLAFNAAIEAARAGEQGQGFRQVAEEVRRLAQQVGELAQQIASRTRDVQQQASDITTVVETSTSHVVSTTQALTHSQTLGQTLVQQCQDLHVSHSALHHGIHEGQHVLAALMATWQQLCNDQPHIRAQAQTLYETILMTEKLSQELQAALHQWHHRPSQDLVAARDG